MHKQLNSFITTFFWLFSQLKPPTDGIILLCNAMQLILVFLYRKSTYTIAKIYLGVVWLSNSLSSVKAFTFYFSMKVKVSIKHSAVSKRNLGNDWTSPHINLMKLKLLNMLIHSSYNMKVLQTWSIFNIISKPADQISIEQNTSWCFMDVFL